MLGLCIHLLVTNAQLRDQFYETKCIYQTGKHFTYLVFNIGLLVFIQMNFD